MPNQSSFKLGSSETLFSRTANLKLSVIKQVELMASKYPDVVSLAQGIPSFDTPLCIKRRVERALGEGVVARYSLSPGLPELRELIELSLARENIFYDWEKEIIVTAGSIEAITATILTITEPGDEVLIPEPTYTSYKEVICLAGCLPIFVPLDESRGWSFDLAQYEKKITDKTKAIFYCNPNNPTGTIYEKEQLLGLADLAQKHNLFLISDEVYKEFIFDRKKNVKIFSLAEIPQLRKRLIRIYSLSKTYAMTGWRVAYLHSDESIAREILKVHDALVTCAPVISQYAAMGALEMADKEVKFFRQEFQKRRDLICERLDRLKHIFEYVKPSSSYYVFPRIKDEYLRECREQKEWQDKKQEPGRYFESPSWQFVLELLDKIQVAVVPGVAFGPNGENHVRMSFGRSVKDINEAFDRMDKLF